MLDRIQSSTLKQLFIYWEHQRHHRPAPSRADIHPGDMVEFLPNVYLIEGEGEPRRFRVRFMGPTLINWCGRDFVGRYVDQITNQALAALHELVTTREPWLVSGQYKNINGRMILYELLALPLLPDEATVDMILGGIAEVPSSEIVQATTL